MRFASVSETREKSALEQLKQNVSTLRVTQRPQPSGLGSARRSVRVPEFHRKAAIRAASRPPVAAISMRAPDFTGRSGDREPCEPRFWVSRCRLQLECALLSSDEIFFVSVLRTKKCVLALAVLPISRSPCENLDRTSDLHPPRQLLRFRPHFGSQSSLASVG